MKRPIDVTLCGYYGFGNLGDELIAEALVYLLEKNGVPKDRIAILAAPGSSCCPEGVLTVDRWDPVSVFSTLRSSSTLLLGGGGLFQDSTSIRSCFYYWGVARMARAVGCTPWAFGQSIGPFGSSIAERLATDALSICVSRAVRDEGSMEWLSGHGLDGEITPDPVMALAGLLGESSKAGEYLLVNIRPWQGDLPLVMARAVSAMARDSGIPVMGVALSDKDMEIMTELRDDGVFRASFIKRVSSIEEVRSVWSSGMGAVGMRLHFCVISAITGTRCIAVPYDPKVSFFADQWGFPTWQGIGSLPDLPACSVTGDRILETSSSIEESFARYFGAALAEE